MIPLPLDDGHSKSGSYRYGDLAVAVPLDNPGLQADREYLLALKDALAGTAELNWSASTATSEWEGVTVAGAPPRVTELQLADRSLDGAIWDWLGDLSELTVLRLDGNGLTGTVPTKLAVLSKLTHVGMAGNALEGCVPPPLREVADNDLATLGLPDCAPPVLLVQEHWESRSTLPSLHTSHGLTVKSAGGSYRWGIGGGNTALIDPRTGEYRVERDPFFFAVLDVPFGQSLLISTVEEPLYDLGPEVWCPPCGFENALEITGGLVVLSETSARADYLWLLLDLGGNEEGRSHYQEDDPVRFAILERIVASAWVNRAIGDDAEWVWP